MAISKSIRECSSIYQISDDPSYFVIPELLQSILIDKFTLATV